jgi:O-succinylbenzoate synthase
VSGLQLFRYRLPLAQPVRSGEQTLTVREGLLIRRTDEHGEAWGEAAPLPGYSDETLPNVIEAARGQDWDRFACLQFAHASLDLPHPRGTIPVAALLSDRHAADGDRMADISQLPHSAVKLKVARGPLEKELELVKSLLQHLRPDQRLRLDANRGWTFDQALHFGNAVADERIEFLEEPTASPDEFERLWHATHLPYALDETLRRPLDLSRFPHAAAWVVKPTLLGGPKQLKRFLDGPTPCIFSAAFESGIGIWNIARLAQTYSSTRPAGLDTYRALSEDVLQPRLSLEAAVLDLTSVWNVDFARLEEIRL